MLLSDQSWYSRVRILALLPVGITLCGCASLAPTQTGFLTNYDAIQPTRTYPYNPNFRKPGLRSAAYRAFMVAPVTFKATNPHGKPDAKMTAILVSDYRQKLRESFLKHYSEADAPGPGVMLVRAAITDARHANPYINGVTMAVALVPVTAGGASTEAEVVDSVTGERLAALEGYNSGGRSFLGGPLGYLSKFGHARRAFKIQADKLEKLVSDTKSK